MRIGKAAALEAGHNLAAWTANGQVGWPRPLKISPPLPVPDKPPQAARALRIVTRWPRWCALPKDPRGGATQAAPLKNPCRNGNVLGVGGGRGQRRGGARDALAPCAPEFPSFALERPRLRALAGRCSRRQQGSVPFNGKLPPDGRRTPLPCLRQATELTTPTGWSAEAHLRSPKGGLPPTEGHPQRILRWCAQTRERRGQATGA